MANWRYDVILGAAGEYIRLENPATGNPIQLIHYRTVIDAVAHVKYKYLYDTYESGSFTPELHDFSPQVPNISATANNATLSQDNWPDPNDPATLSTSQLPVGIYKDSAANLSQQWFVRLRYNDGRFLDLPMGGIVNQPTWVNTQGGAAQCIEDIQTVITA